MLLHNKCYLMMWYWVKNLQIPASKDALHGNRFEKSVQKQKVSS